jgi:hypothetical protein
MFSQILSSLNWLHIIVANEVYYMLGALWYGKILFAPAWVKGHNIDVNAPDAKKGMASFMIMGFVLMLINVFGIAVLQQALHTNGWMGALKLALFTGIVFNTSAISLGYNYTKKPLSVYLIDAGYQVIGTSIASIILAVWQ